MIALEEILTINELKTYFSTDRGLIKAIDDISLTLYEGEVLGMVGESGCGKSMTALSIMGLIPFPGEIVEGEIYLKSEELTHLEEREMRRLRGSEISMIFQDPLTTLNPVIKVGEQITESIRLHQGGGLWTNRPQRLPLLFHPIERQKYKEKAWRRALEMMEQVGISSPEERMREYPHQFSGGMRQRAMIAIALSCNPSLLIADEPTTALDVTIQAQILDLMKRIQRESGMSILFISHDLGVICELCHRVAVMYAGKIVEMAYVDEVMESPLHPYTKGLLSSIPRLESLEYRIKPIPGTIPDPLHLPKGCNFAPRCSFSQEICRERVPPLEEVEGHQISCFFFREIEERGGLKDGDSTASG